MIYTRYKQSHLEIEALDNQPAIISNESIFLPYNHRVQTTSFWALIELGNRVRPRSETMASADSIVGQSDIELSASAAVESPKC